MLVAVHTMRMRAPSVWWGMACCLSARSVSIAFLLSCAVFATDAQDRPKLTLGMVGFTAEVGSPFVEYARMFVPVLERRTGVDLELVAYPAYRSVEMVNDDQLDGDIARTMWAAARSPNICAVPTPDAHMTVAVFASTPAIAQMSREEISRLSVGTIRGDFAMARLSAGMRRSESGGIASAFEMLRNHRVDVVMLDYVTSKVYLDNHAIRDVYLWPHTWAVEPLHILLHKKHADLVATLDAGLQKMEREGELARFFDEALRNHGIEPLPP